MPIRRSIAMSTRGGSSPVRALPTFHYHSLSLSSVRSLARAVLLIAMVCGLACTKPAWAGIGFQPVNPDELKMTSEPLAPGAPAVILYRQIDRDDNGRTSHEDVYYRIKIFTEEGRKYADVEIPFWKKDLKIVGVHARTIRPDGSIHEFDGKVYEKTVVKDRTGKVLVKTFNLPDVEPGCVIEYGYTSDLEENALFESHWIVTEDMFTRDAKFSLKPYIGTTYNNQFGLRWSWNGLPDGTNPPVQGPDKIVRMEAHNIAAFQHEDFMPPEEETKLRVDFVYNRDLVMPTQEKYWRDIGKQRNGALEAFIGKRKAMEEAVGKIVSPNDAPEVKLRKIYDRVQQIRNTSYEVHKTEQEEKRDKEKPPANVEELWKRGYGSGGELTWLYLALVRAAGFQAYGCWVSDRRQYFFNSKMMQAEKLNSNVVLVKLNGKDLYFDPGAAFTPYGLLTWSETGTPGIRLDGDGGDWIVSMLPGSSESQIQRTAKLKLSDTGDLEGKLTITYTGLEGMYRRLGQRNVDDVERKKFLEEQIKDQIPSASEIELTNKPDWTNSETPLVAEFDMKVPGWAGNAGKRAMLPVGFFTVHEKHIFEHADRMHPIYWEYPYQKVDDVTIELPAGWQVSSVPPAKSNDGHVIGYELKVDSANGSVHVYRKLNVDFLLLDKKYYSALRNFFQTVRSGDDEQVVLQPGTANASN